LAVDVSFRRIRFMTGSLTRKKQKETGHKEHIYQQCRESDDLKIKITRSLAESARGRKWKTRCAQWIRVLNVNASTRIHEDK
jgi:hypothetical protein